jgi:hypothetical protein
MAISRGHESAGQNRARRGLAKVTSLALGLAMFGTVGLSGTLAQEEDVSVGTADAEAIVNDIIAQVFAEIFGGGVVEDDAADTGAGDLITGGSTGSTVTMGGGGGDILIGGGISGGSSSGSSGGSGGGVTIGDNNGG